eukprot:TRINITY_DN36714_c0_g1_i1.p1 TRINITY_DN36714_c0_g1~~TRINITY_DN36714_c0_g1_i1.p1  ORF type:complete len:103 (+),score=7.72 TRINITY_DN36714_c0_g1_i1:59-367(+)
MTFYRLVYQTTMYRTTHYLMGILGMAYFYEQGLEKLAEKMWRYNNDGAMMYQMRRKITDDLREEGEEKISWHLPIFWSCPSPKPENFELKTGNPRWPATESE